jgi:GDPmannose 4,6-dehydratase
MRTSKFVSKKIAQFVSTFDPYQGITLELGNVEARRDWGYAGDYVVAMNRMLDLEKFGTYVIATGVQHSVRDFLNAAFMHIGVEDWSKYIAFNEEFNRKTDHNNLAGDSSKAFSELGWKAETPFSKLVQIMVDGD